MADLDAAVLNDGLALAMEWGDEWLRPIQERLARAHPELTSDDLDRYDTACRAAMDRGHGLVSELMQRERLAPGDELWRRFRAVSSLRDPWISDDNLGHLYSQGCYYAMK
jgi:hypothetical protein